MTFWSRIRRWSDALGYYAEEKEHARWRKKHPLSQGSFAPIIEEAILKELRPSTSFMKFITTKKDGPNRFEINSEAED